MHMAEESSLGINDEKEVVGIKNSKQLMEDIPNKHTSKPRNLNIANAFYKAGFIESWGRGIGIIQAGFKNAGLPAPKLEATMGGVLVVLPRGCQKTNETVNETVNDTATRQVSDKYPTSTRQALREAKYSYTL